MNKLMSILMRIIQKKVQNVLLLERKERRIKENLKAKKVNHSIV